jgi:hypothetical protein
LFPCEPNTLSANASSRHNFQLTKTRPEGHNLTTSFRGKLAQETNCQIQQQPGLTFMLVLLPL